MKTRTMRCMTWALALGGGALPAAAWSAPSNGLPAESPAPPWVVSAAAGPMVTVVPQAEMPVDCLRAWSKDLCDGFMYPGNEVFGSCPFPPMPCKTVTVTDATLVISVKRNETLCAADGKCDESPETDGRLKMTTNYEIRLQKPCPFRGCWDGKWELQTVSGAVFQGEAMGTLGVGTHRDFACPEHRTGICEKCLDVQFIPTPIGGLWRIGWEGAFSGKRVDFPNGERLCFTVSGDWYLAGDFNSPFDFNGNFRVFAAADGVHAVPCGF